MQRSARTRPGDGSFVLARFAVEPSNRSTFERLGGSVFLPSRVAPCVIKTVHMRPLGPERARMKG